MFIALIFIILIVYLFDFTKMRTQNDKLIEQNDQIISLLADIKKQDDSNQS